MPQKSCSNSVFRVLNPCVEVYTHQQVGNYTGNSRRGEWVGATNGWFLWQYLLHLRTLILCILCLQKKKFNLKVSEQEEGNLFRANNDGFIFIKLLLLNSSVLRSSCKTCQEWQNTPTFNL